MYLLRTIYLFLKHTNKYFVARSQFIHIQLNTRPLNSSIITYLEFLDCINDFLNLAIFKFTNLMQFKVQEILLALNEIRLRNIKVEVVLKFSELLATLTKYFT